jgi:D-tyrosyl-tRNA(Tyr) deacylase
MARAVVQRVRSAAVDVDDRTVASIGRGFAILLAIRQGDTDAQVERLADKVGSLRIFEDDAGKMNVSAADVGGAMLVVSQFTLYGDVRKGRRPSFIQAAGPEEGERLYRLFASRLEAMGYEVQCGQFRAHMLVRIENDGPVTLIIDSEDL